MKKTDHYLHGSNGSIKDEPLIPLSKVKSLSNEYENTIHKLMELLNTRGLTTDTWGKPIDTIASNGLDHASIYLLDYENIGNFPALITTWNKPSDIIYCFMNKNQVAHFDHESSRLEPSLSKRIHPIVLSTSGMNALDIAIGMFIGHISARYQPLGIYVYTNDRGYGVLMDICRFWGINNVEIRQAISVVNHPKDVDIPMVKPEHKPSTDHAMVKPLIQLGQPIKAIKSKIQRKPQIESLMEYIRDAEWLDHPIPLSELNDKLIQTFPNTPPGDIDKLISRMISYGFIISKKGKLTLVKSSL